MSEYTKKKYRKKRDVKPSWNLISEGIKRKDVISIAQEMITRHCSIDKISQITGLSKEEIEQMLLGGKS